MKESCDDWRFVLVDGMYWAFGYGYNERTKEVKVLFWVTLRVEDPELEPW